MGRASLGLLEGRRVKRGAAFLTGFLGRAAFFCFAAFLAAGFLSGFFLAFDNDFFFVAFFFGMQKVYHLRFEQLNVTERFRHIRNWAALAHHHAGEHVVEQNSDHDKVC